MNPPLRVLLLAAAFAAAWAGVACADDVILKDGRKFTGDILKETDEKVVLQTAGGPLEFRRADILQIVSRVSPRKTYKQKSDALASKEIASRLDLARWCLAQGLEAEARREIDAVLQIDPQNRDALDLQGKIKAPAPDVPVTVEVTLSDGSQVKGRLLNPVFSLETPYGTLRIPSRTVTAVTLGDGKTPDSVETETFRAKGQLAEEVFAVESKLGRLSIARKDVKSMVLTLPTPEQVADIEFNDAMRQLNFAGLDIVFVVDATDTMTASLARLRTDAKRIVNTVRRFVPNAQFGLVAFRDHKVFDPAEFTWVTQVTPLAEKPDDMLGAVSVLRAKGGGDIPNAVFDGLSDAMTKPGWRAKSVRIIVLIGDSPPHLENDGLKKTVALAGEWHKNAQGAVNIVDTTGFGRMLDEYKAIAEAGGGKAVPADDKTLSREALLMILGGAYRDRILKVFDESAEK